MDFNSTFRTALRQMVHKSVAIHLGHIDDERVQRSQSKDGGLDLGLGPVNPSEGTRESPMAVNKEFLFVSLPIHNGPKQPNNETKSFTFPRARECE